MTQKFELEYDAKSRIVSVTGVDSTTHSANFVFDGNGQRVRVASTINGETILFIGSFELNATTNQVTKHYPGGAIRKYTIPQNMNVEYVLGDHLGSASIMTNSNGGLVSEMRYDPWGQVRYAHVESGVSTTPAYTLPKHTFTGQYSYMDDLSTQNVTEGFGLMFYNARWYDPALGRMAQADTVVPGGVQGLDRYAYANNNPLYYTDPSGHVNQSQCNYLKNYNCEAPEVMKKWEKLRLAVLNLMYAGDSADLEILHKNVVDALTDFANFLGIHLPDTDSWEFYNGTIVEDGKVVLGLNPIGSRPHFGIEDLKVYITRGGFIACEWNWKCLAGEMFHEAGHAWLEIAVPESKSKHCLELCTYDANEELMMNDLAQKRFGDPLGILNGYTKYFQDSSACKPDLCTDPAGYLTSEYDWSSNFEKYIWLLVTGGSLPYPD